MSWEPQMAAARKPIAVALGRLEAEVEAAATETGCIETELATILAPPSPARDQPEPKPPKCPGLASTIDDRADEVHDIVERLRKIRQRSEL